MGLVGILFGLALLVWLSAGLPSAVNGGRLVELHRNWVAENGSQRIFHRRADAIRSD